MTYGEFFNSEYYFDCALGIFSYLTQSLTMINIILVAICFLGFEGKISKKTIIFSGILFGIGVVLNAYSIITALVYTKYYSNVVIPEEVGSQDVGEVFSLIIRILICIIMFLTAFFSFDRRRIIRGIEAVIALIAISSYMEILIVNAVAFISGDFSKTYDDYLNVTSVTTVQKFYILIFFIIQISLLFILYFMLYKKQRFIYIGWIYRILFIAWEVVGIFIGNLMYTSDTTSNVYTRRLEIILGIIFLLMTIVIPALIFILIARKNAVNKTLIQEEYISSELEYINQYKKSQEETRAFRHDIANNLSLLAAMMDEGKSEEAKEYLDGLLGDVRGMSPKYVTGDEMLDCIVGMKASRMDEEEIDFKLDGMIDGGLGMKPVDVCNIFANALDNAIEACERIPEKTDRWVSLLVKRTDKFFSIKLSNSVKEEKNGISLDKLFDGISRKTSKKDKNLHGFGTLNMKKALEKYGGMLKSEQEGDAFTVSIMIPR